MKTLIASLLLTGLLLMGLLLPGCASDDVALASGTYHVTAERHGQTARIPLGDKLAILLPTIAGSPSHWTPSVSDQSVVSDMLARSRIAPRVNGAIIGGTQGYERLEFQTLRPGTATVRVTRAVDRAAPAVFQINVVVVDEPAELPAR